jgi:dTDP-4-amino-4,6-dideoxygalactose transaminase
LVDPFLAFGARVRYYTVQRDFNLDLDEIEFLAKQGVQALLYIHFSGFPAPVAALQKISRTYEVKLIEDCSHALFGQISNRPMGSFGDAAVFSFRKALPVQDGGALILNNAFGNDFSPRFKAPWLYHARMSKWTWESMYAQDQNNNHVPMHANGAKSEDASVLRKNYSNGPNSHEEPAFIKRWVNWPISWPSRWLLLRSHPEMIRRRRAENYLRLHECLAHIDRLKPCFPDLPSGVCPLGYPCIAESNERFDYKLRRYGIPAFSFGEILHDSLIRQKFPDSEFLSKNLTILPVHQRLSDDDIDKMAEVISNVLK